MVQALCFAASTRFPPCNEARLCCTSGDQYVVVCCWFCLLLVSPRLFLHGLLAHKINFQIVIRYVIRKPHFLMAACEVVHVFFFRRTRVTKRMTLKERRMLQEMQSFLQYSQLSLELLSLFSVFSSSKSCHFLPKKHQPRVVKCCCHKNIVFLEID